MRNAYAIKYRWHGRSFYTVVAGADRGAAVNEFRREFPYVEEIAGSGVKSVRPLVIGGAKERKS